jgi:hypothetical protein
MERGLEYGGCLLAGLFFLGKELLHNKRYVARDVILMQKPLPLPLVTLLPPNRITQPLHNLHIEITTNTLSSQYRVIVHQTIVVKEFQELFDLPSYIR